MPITTGYSCFRALVHRSKHMNAITSLQLLLLVPRFDLPVQTNLSHVFRSLAEPCRALHCMPLYYALPYASVL